MKLAFALVLLALLFATPAHANGLDVYVTAWDSHSNTTFTPNGVVYNPSDQIFWTFKTGLSGPAPTDTNPQDVAYYGPNVPFAIEALYYGPLGADGLGTATNKATAPNTDIYNALYGNYTNAYPIGDPFITTFAGMVHLTDENGFVTGLPFEQNCTSQCTNYINPAERADTLAEFAWLNSSLSASNGGINGHKGRGPGRNASSSAPDPITGSATLTVGDPITGSALLTINPTPTPEPSSLVLLGLGIVAAIALYRASAKTQSQNPRLVE